ncbi:MAG: hypothetical protein ACP5M7_08220 [Thermoproteota archaeon]
MDEIRYKSADELFEEISLGMPPGEIVLNWAEGVVFIHEPILLNNETTIREWIEKGRLYWLSVRYAPMEEYKENVVKSTVTIRIRKIKTPILIEVAKELKKRCEKT